MLSRAAAKLPLVLALVVLALAAPTPALGGAPFEVDTTSDADLSVCTPAPDNCSLRGAVNLANSVAGPNIITFSIDSGLQTISPLSALPEITGPVIIDGTTQPGGGSTPRIELSGLNAGNGVNGLVLSGGDSTLKGLAINRFGGTSNGAGVWLKDAGHNVVEGNFIGTDPTGTMASGNRTRGVWVTSPENRIGGTTGAQRNVISGNNERGIMIIGADAGGNVVQGNYIGVDVTGTSPVSNSVGVHIQDSPNNVIGGSAPGEGNVISANEKNQIEVIRSESAGNVIEGNLIGTNAAGSAVVSPVRSRGVSPAGGGPPPIPDGISISDLGIGSSPSGTVIHRNTISGHPGDGIGMRGGTGTIITANRFGTSAFGSSVLSNGESGIELELSNDTQIGDLPGGIDSTAANTIRYNGRAGVDISGGAGNSIYGNQISDNDGLGIDLDGDGVTANDAGDADLGANELQNYPELTAVTSGGGEAHIEGSFDSSAGEHFWIEYFLNEDCDPSGFGEGRSPFAGGTSISDGSGHANINVTFLTNIPVGNSVTAIATDADGNSSEFSNCVRVKGGPEPTPTPEPTVTPTPTPGPTGTPATTPTATPGGSKTVAWGDNQCDDDVDPVDALMTLRQVAGLDYLPPPGPCPMIGVPIGIQAAGFGQQKWGDSQCDGDVDAVDALAILRFVAALSPLSQHEPCPDIGDDVVIAT